MDVETELTIVVIATAITVTLLILFAARAPRIRPDRVRLLFEAALTGEQDLIRQRIGRSVDRRNKEGNTALHLAYYHGRQEAIDALVAFGAGENLRNKERLLPAEMSEVAAIERLLTDGARLLDRTGEWLDRERAREVYDQLSNRKPRIFNPALVRCVLRGPQTQLVHLAIRLGVFGSEKKLAEVLHGYGSAALATDYLNSGSAVLRQAAEVWASRNGYTIHFSPGVRSLTWGRF
jgi:hypothetical protein